MKNLILLVVVISMALSCKSKEGHNSTNARFGIYETIRVKDIPSEVWPQLDTTGIHIEINKEQPIIGYIPKNEKDTFNLKIKNDNLMILKTVFTVDPNNKYLALVTVKPLPEITGQHIKTTKNIGKNVEIRFNMTGAKKWADMINKNPGNMVAFIINDLVYSLPVVNGAIDNGRALISGIDDEQTAKKISDMLNNVE